MKTYIFTTLFLVFIIYNTKAQFTTPSVNGTIAGGEYGVHTDGNNKQGNTYMTWDATNLYIGVTSGNTAEALVIYIDKDNLTPVDGGTNADGTNVGFTYDGSGFAKLPFRADIVMYVKSGYREFRTANGSNGWSAQTTNAGTFAESGGNIREYSFPWTSLPGGAKPAAFNWFSYVTSGGGFVYNQVPSENGAGFIGTSARYSRYYNITNTNNGSSTLPMSRNCYVFNSAADISNEGIINAYDFTMNDGSRFISRSNAGGNWNITGTLLVNAGTVFFGSGGSGYGTTNVNNIQISGGSLNMDQTNQPMNIDGNLVLSSGSFYQSGTSGGNINLKGNWTYTSGTYGTFGRTLTFNGTTGQTITGNTIFDNLALNNNAGMTLAGTATVNGLLTLSGGNINSSVTNILKLGSSSSLSRTAGMVVGPVQKTIPSATGSHTFPVGDGTIYHPAIVNFTGSPIGGELSAEFKTGDPVFGVAAFNHGGIPITDVCQTGYWQVTAISGVTGGTYSIEVDATGFKMDNGSPLSNLSLLRLIKRPTAGSWAAEGTAAAPSNLNSISLTGLNTFSEFGVGGGGGAFPIELLYFTGHAEATSNIIEWATATEKNNQYQIVERSANGIDGWKETGRKAGAGTSTTPIAYKSEDVDPLLLGYYRLRAVDFDGSEQISGVVSILRESDELTIVNAFPVPVAEKLTLQVSAPVSGEVTVTLTDALGRIVLIQDNELQRGINEVKIDMEVLSSGIYQVTLTDGTVSVSKSIIK